MRTQLLALISVLLLVFSGFLVYHLVSNDDVKSTENTGSDEYTSDLSNEIDSFLLNEDYEVDIGEII